jgi:hypothetical protein
MHIKDRDESPKSRHEEDVREAVNAADDTGLVQQQELIVETELGLPVGGDDAAKR